MPRYFFSCEGAQNFRDEVGTELADMAAVRVEAIQNCAEILKDHAGDFSASPCWRAYVTDESGRTVFELSFTATES